MKDFLASSAFFGLLLSIGAYLLGCFLQKKTGSALCNPLIVSSVLVIAVLLLLRVPYETYENSAGLLTWMLTPATVCLAVPLYKQLRLLKEKPVPIFLGILSGVLASLFCILLVSYLFRLSKSETVTLLPKSVTTAIGMGVSEECGGIPSLTVAAIVVTGVTGNLCASILCKLLRIRDPIAKGLAIGTASHALGTAKALEMGEVEGAMSSLSIAVAGVITAFLIPAVVPFLP